MLHRFNITNGAHPEAGLIFDAAGNLYGTTYAGGAPVEAGTVFELSPPAAGRTAWTETVLRRFNRPGAAYPDAGVILDAGGNLYGTTSSGGNLIACRPYNTGGCGTVFELTP